jgi:hypothetical protein
MQRWVPCRIGDVKESEQQGWTTGSMRAAEERRLYHFTKDMLETLPAKERRKSDGEVA